MYLVISGSDDYHIRFVERHLDEPFLLLDTRAILEQKACSYAVRNNQVEILYDGSSLKNIRSVWYRRAMRVQGFELPVVDEYRPYAETAIRYYNKLIFAQLSHVFWLSDYFAIERADDKLWQLQVAGRLGFDVPETLFTASPEEAVAFVKDHGPVIAKPNYASRFQKQGKPYAFYTSFVDETTDFSGLRVAPAILQQAITPKMELRITVVGDKVFAATVTEHATHAQHLRDWRISNLTQDTTFKPYDLPTNFKKKCIQLVKELGLYFGAMDVILDTKGKYWFLENNPNGQWAFIEEATGLPIGKAVADLLMHPGMVSK